MTTARILVVEDNPIVRKMMRVALSAEGYAVIEAEDGATALRLASSERPDLVIEDLVLPDIDGVELAARLRELPGGDELPIILCSGFVSRVAECRVAEVGFVDVLIKPVAPSDLVRCVRLHLDPEPKPERSVGRRVLLVDDDPIQLKLGRVRLELAGFEVSIARDGQEALDAARRHRPDAIVSDVLMPRVDGFALCLAVRRDPALRTLPVVLLTNSYVEDEDARLATEAGAQGLLVRTPDLARAIEAVHASMQRPPEAFTVAAAALPERHVARIIAQLERQAALNVGLRQRAAAQATALSILRAIAEAVAKGRDADAAFDEIVAHCGDAGGFALAALWVAGDAGLVLRASSVGGLQAGDAQRFFGHPEVFTECLVTGAPIEIPSAAVGDAVARDFLARAGVASALLVPVLWGETRYGVLVVGADRAERPDAERFDVGLAGDERLDFARSMGAHIGQAMALQRAFSDLSAAEERYRRLFEQAAEGIYEAGPDGRLLLVNGAMARIFGYVSPEAMLAAVDRLDRCYVKPSDPHDLMRRIAADGVASRVETEMRRGDGQPIWVSQSVRAITDARGRPAFYQGVLEDVTERRRVEEALRQTEKLSVMGTMLAGVAHELNNPLAVVLAHVQLLRQTAQGALAERADKISAAAERCARIVKNFLALARQRPPERDHVDLARVVREAAELVAYPLRMDNVTVTTDFAPDVPSVWADQHQLHQVLVNLVTNAHHALRHAPPPRQIQIGTRFDRVRQRVLLEVSDTGPGIPPEVQARIFEPFFTTKPPGEGTGLGLPLCRSMVESHGGTLTVDSLPGAGTTITIELPLMQPPAHAPAAMREVPVAVRGRSILVVDDEEEVASVVGELLASDGHDVDIVANGAAALARIEAAAYDVVFCDLRMPVLDGPGLYRALERRGHPALRRLIFMSGDALGSDTHRFLEDTGVLHVGKPLGLEELRRAIGAALAR